MYVDHAHYSYLSVTTYLQLHTGKAQAPDLSNAQANLQAASTRAGAYFSSWGTWASEKRKGWGAPKSPLSPPPPTDPVPGDIKRAEEFKRGEKDRHSINGAKSPPLVKVTRESLLFDAEKDDVEKEKTKEEVNEHEAENGTK